MKQDTAEPQQDKQAGNRRGKGTKTGLILSIVLNVLLLAAIGWLWWQLKVCMDREAELEKSNNTLQSQNEQLKRLQAAATTPATDTTACSSTVTQTIKDNVRDAINSDNTAALVGYMATSVKVVIAASEFGQTRTPAQAIADLNYVHDSSGWNFALPAATTSSYLAGSYGTGSPGGVNYFTPTTYFGKASDDKLVAFNFDSCAKIDQVFMAVSADLLL